MLARTASKTRPSLPSGRSHRSAEPSLAQKARSSKVLDTLDAQVISGTEASDSSIEIFEGICVSVKKKLSAPPSNPMQRSKRVHPFFLKNYTTQGRAESPSSAPSKSKATNLDGADNSSSAGTISDRHASSAVRKIPSKASPENNGPSASDPPDETSASLCAHNATEDRSVLKNLASDPRSAVPKSIRIKATKSISPSTVASVPPEVHVPTKQQPGSARRVLEVTSKHPKKVPRMKGAEVHESALPVYSFMDYGNMEPAVVYTQSEDEANDAVQTLKGPLGFDLEWRVMWHAGAKERRTALVQLCDKKTILLVQVSHMKRFPQKLLEAIESPSIVKTGANIMNDGEKLFRDFGIRARNLVELGSLARQADDKFTTVYNRNIVSLAKMVSMYLGKTLAKGKERTANWEGELSSAMVHYAANDAHSALMVYHRLLDLASDAGKSLRESMFSAEVTPRVIATAPSAPALAPSSSSSSAFSSSTLASSVFLEPPRPQHLRAYNLWYHRKMPLEMMCMTLKNKARVEPLKESTVISYVIGALQADPSLPFNMDKLKDLVRMEASSWQRHRQWIQEAENRRPTV